MKKQLSRRGIVEKVIPHSKLIERMPGRITKDVLSILASEGLAFTPSSDRYKAAEEIRNAGNRIVMLPLEHRITQEEANKILKNVNPQNYHYLNNPQVIQKALRHSYHFAKMARQHWDLPDGMSIEQVKRLTGPVLKESGMLPYFLQKAASELSTTPKIGFYWLGTDGKPTATTWMRDFNARHIYGLFDVKDSGYTLDKEFYGRNIGAIVPSMSTKGRDYPFNLMHIPIFDANDREQYAYWRKLETDDPSPDAYYTGKAHDKRDPATIFFTTNAIAAFYAANARLKRTHEKGHGKGIQVNPFPLLIDPTLVDILNTQTLIDGQTPSMIEKDLLVDADITNQGYDNVVANWTG